MVTGELKEGAVMEELKLELKREARRHSNKLIKKITQVIDIPDIISDSIHQEILYATMDGYRATMKSNRNGSSKNEETQEEYQTRGNC